MKVIIAGLIAAGAVYVAWMAGSGRELPFGLSPTAALWVAAGLGMAACAVGPLSVVAATGDWGSPWTIAGIVVGVAALAAVAAAATGTTLGVVADTRQWMLVLAGLIGAKVLLATAHAVFAAGTLVAKG